MEIQLKNKGFCPRIYFILMLFALLPISRSLWADDVIVIGIEDLNYYPIVLHQNGQWKGFLPELLDQMANQTHLEYRLQAFPVARLKVALKAGAVDIQFPDNPLWNDSIDFPKYYSKPIVPYQDGYFVLRTNEKKVPEVVGTVLGFSIMSPLDSAKQTYYPDSAEALFKMLSKGRIDAAYLNTDVGKNFSDAHELDAVWRSDLPYDQSFFYFGAMSDHVLLERIDNFIDANPEFVMNLLNKYGLLAEDHKEFTGNGYKVGYVNIPSAPDFSDSSNTENPFFGHVTTTPSQITVSTPAKIHELFCLGFLDQIYPVITTANIRCDYQFKSLFNINTVLVTQPGQKTGKKAVGVLDGYGLFEDNWPELKGYDVRTYDQDAQIIAQFKSGRLQAMVLEENNFKRLEPELAQVNYQIAREQILEIGVGLRSPDDIDAKKP